MATMLALGIALGLCIGAVLWDVIFCDPLRRDNDELRLQAVRRNLRAAGDRMGYVEYRLQHRGTPYIVPADEQRRQREQDAREAGWDRDLAMMTDFALSDTRDHSKSAELRAV